MVYSQETSARIIIFSFGFFALLFFSVTFSTKTYAAANYVSVGAQVPGPVATISGIASPNAFITASSSAQVLGSTSSDSQSNFSFVSLGLFNGIKELCFDMTDFKKLGNSLSCLTFAPLYVNKEFQNVFLPPTIGLSANKITTGGSVTIQGYSVALAAIEIRVRGSKNFVLSADKSGLYSYSYQNVPAGTYHISAAAIYKKQKSLEPKNEVELIVSSSAVGTTREAGKVKTYLSPWLIFFIFLIVLIPALGFLGVRTEQGKVLWYKFLNTKIGMKIRGFMSKIRGAMQRKKEKKVIKVNGE